MVLLVVVTLLMGCKDELRDVVNQATDPELVPSVRTTQVQTVVSDSGHTRYRITSPEWLMFEEAREPHWVFPRGVVAEELDAQFRAVRKISCDSAHFSETKNLWSLNGNVNITMVSGDVIATDQMYWNTQSHEFYSDAFVHLEKDDRIIEGTGYHGNEQDGRITNYYLKKVSAIIPFDASRLPQELN